MQNRMKTHQLSQEKLDNLLARAETASLAMLNLEGSPYVIPVQFVYHNKAIYIHGLPKGQKIDCITADPRVSMTIYDMQGLLFGSEGGACNVNTKYESAVLFGRANLLEDFDQKLEALTKIVEKYTPHLAQKKMPENMIKGTAVIKVVIESITGKFYR